MQKAIRAILIGTIIVTFLMRLNLALTRGFDPDEFSYLHWAWLVARGYLPYRDFFFYILPGFPWILSIVLFLTGDTTIFLIASRVLMFVVYSTCAGLVYKLTKMMDPGSKAGMTTSFLAVLIFLTFPMTLDKTIDIRPDLVMLILYFISAWILFQPQKARPFKARTIISGVLFGISFLVLPKIVVGLPALLYLLVSHLQPQKIKQFQTILIWTLGAVLVGILFLLYLQANGITLLAYQALTKDSLAVTSGKYGFSPLLLLTPYPLIYLSSNTPSLPWIVNTIIWIVSIVGFIRLVTIADPKVKALSIFLTLFIAGNIVFIILFPAPYVQYFLPLSIAASVLAGLGIQYLVFSILGLGKKDLTIPPPLNTYPYILISLVLLASFFLQYRERVAPNANNREQLQVIRDVLKVTKPTETIYDMVGSFVFRPDGFFICCHPYREFVHSLGSRPGLERGLRESLILRQTKFLVMDQVGFVFWQTPEPDLAFLRSNYLPMKYPKLYSLGIQFRCQNRACVQYTMNDQSASNQSTNIFTILVPETYTVTLEPSNLTVTIDSKEIQNGQKLGLSAGVHRFSVSPTTNSFRIQLTR